MGRQKNRPIVLSIAGFDPSGGAGVLADIKTFEQLEVQGMAIITANTIQTENTLSYVDWLDIKVIRRGIEVLMQRYMITVVKIGIIKNVAFLEDILTCVRACNPGVFIIWDPVLKSSSGAVFFQEDGGRSLAAVINHIDLITPNFDEYQILEPYFKNDFSNALLIKGGHRDDHTGMDVLRQGTAVSEIHPHAPKIYPKHGSGCVLSSAVAAYIAWGNGLEEACRKAKVYTERFLNSHSSLLGFHYENK
ncbi:hydroxymethylpyrimidine/phosphomethylpyrimidine kinase [Sphingobacterium chuzhouense]|uniref:hydroxymethylpyrimidine kinase n=1 Tax=Sphingobacterium chuzhouense TaxID=1742264 RepID=A0ABR7XQU7_9SPHI|nr:hydroxymethylpyrimidine/phosphomethylpyrimidine kinase [Sphingobacterium chuzhouense]MBD1421556.1 hydroxymethylpyrimidine/phosphomethylpyrimidine kinase [Sphingobacterium chuzhouense]